MWSFSSKNNLKIGSVCDNLGNIFVEFVVLTTLVCCINRKINNNYNKYIGAFFFLQFRENF